MDLHILFRIFYTTFYTILNIVLVALLVITPADAINQALKNHQLYNVFVVAGGYLLTILLAILIYASRLYTNRSVLAAIPKTWIPVEKGDVNKRVRKMIASSLGRSAAIAWDSRPRAPNQPPTVVSEPDTKDAIAKPPEPDRGNSRRFLRKSRTLAEKDEQTIVIPPSRPDWRGIGHNGWSSPTSPDLPNLQYVTVVLELPHLIEAKAVSLAPPDPDSTSNPPMPDLWAIDVLQRPASTGLRDYISHLASVGVMASPTAANDFLTAYEYARFSSRPLTETEFRDLMKHFAEVLRSMQDLSPTILMSLDIDQPESDIEDESSTSTPITRRSQSPALARTPSVRRGSKGTVHSSPSRRIGTSGTTTHRPTEYSTAPATPKSKKWLVSRSSSMNSFAQSRQPYFPGAGSSSESLASTSQGSVIRLNRSNEEGDLPYTLIVPGTG